MARNISDVAKAAKAIAKEASDASQGMKQLSDHLAVQLKDRILPVLH